MMTVLKRKKATQNATNEVARGSVTTPREVEKSLVEILNHGESARVSAAMAIAKSTPNACISKSDSISDRLKDKSQKEEELELIAFNWRAPANSRELHSFTECLRKEREKVDAGHSSQARLNCPANALLMPWKIAKPAISKKLSRRPLLMPL